jgi:hypothetical protein
MVYFMFYCFVCIKVASLAKHKLYKTFYQSAIKSRKLRWAGHVACMGKGEVHTGFWWGNLPEDNLEDPGVDWSMILK